MRDELSVLIVDDEANARKLLKSILREFNNVRLLAEASSAKEAYKLMEDELPDVVLLDIEMPEESGFDLVNKMRANGLITRIIFTTAYNQYAIKAIRHAAFDYLLKPIDVKELKEALSRLKGQENSNHAARMDRLLKAFGNPKRIKINVRSGFIMLDLDDIIFAEADGNYSTLHLLGGAKEVASQSLGKLIDCFPASMFSRISRSHFINLNYLVQFDRRTRMCTLDVNGHKEELRVSVRHIRTLEETCERLSS